MLSSSVAEVSLFERVKELVDANQFDKLKVIDLSQLTREERNILNDIAFEKGYWEIVALFRQFGVDKREYQQLNKFIGKNRKLVKDEKSGQVVLLLQEQQGYGDNFDVKPSPYLVPILDLVMDTECDFVKEIIVPLHQRTIVEQLEHDKKFLKWMLEMCKAVQEMHSQGFVHRDIMPDNFFVYGDMLKLFFTWYSCRIGYEDDGRFGTSSFRAPEVFLEDVIYNTPIDIFSLGVTFFCLFFPGHRDNLNNSDSESIPPLLANSSIPSTIKKLILKMIDLKPENRPSIEECIEVIRQARIHEPFVLNDGLQDCYFIFETHVQHFEKGISLYLKGNFESAIFHLKSLQSLLPSTGIRMLLANSFLNIGEYSEYINLIESVLRDDSYCKYAHVHKIIYLISCGRLVESKEAYKSFKQIEEFSDVDFGEFQVGLEIWKKIIKSTNVFVIPEWDNEDDVQYIIIHYQRRVCIVYMKDVTEIDDIYEICKRKFNNPSLDLLVDMENNVIESSMSLIHKKHYLIKVRNQADTQDNVLKIGKPISDNYYEDANNPSRVIQFIPTESEAFDIYKKLENHIFNGIRKIFAASTTIHNEEEKHYIIMERCKSSLYDNLNETLSLKELCQLFKYMGRCVQQLHNEEIIHMNCNLESFFINLQDRIVLANLDSSLTVHDLDVVKGGPDEVDIIFEIETKGTPYTNSPEYYYHKCGLVGKIIGNVYSLDSWSFGATILWCILKYLLGKKYNTPKDLLQIRDNYFGIYTALNNSHKEIHEFVHDIIYQAVESYEIIPIMKEIICGLLHKNSCKRSSIEEVIQQLDLILNILSSKEEDQ